MTQYVGICFGKIEIGMIAEVHRRCFVRDRLNHRGQLVVVVKRISHRYLKVSRIALFVVFAEISEGDSRPGSIGKLFSFPHNFVKPFDATMQMIRAIVDCQRVFPAVEDKLPFGNTVGITADQGSKIGI